MQIRAVGESAMTGWRAKLGERVAEPVSKRSPLTPEQVYAGIGFVFLALSLWYVGSTLVRAYRKG
jgi:hypothetical protein